MRFFNTVVCWSRLIPILSAISLAMVAGFPHGTAARSMKSTIAVLCKTWRANMEEAYTIFAIRHSSPTAVLSRMWLNMGVEWPTNPLCPLLSKARLFRTLLATVAPYTTRTGATSF